MKLHRVDALFARFCATGDSDALGEVFDRTAPELARIAGHLCADRNAAEDLFFLEFPFFFVSYGLRVRANPRWALDIAMVRSLSNTQPTVGGQRGVFDLLGFPLLVFTYRWGPK